MKYEIITNLINETEESEKFSDLMEALAGNYIKDNKLNIEVDDLWNDATADVAREHIQTSRENGGVFDAHEFFDWLLSPLF